MKKIDLYIIRKFLGTFFFILALLMAIAVVFDVSEKIDGFIKRQAPFKAIVFDHYLNFILHFGNLFSPLLIFIAVILFTSKLAQNSEIIAILNAGMSFKRLMRPYFLSATFLALLSLLLNHFLLPEANQKRIDFENTYMHSAFHIKAKNLHREIEPGTIFFFESFNAEKEQGHKFSIEKWKDNKMTYKLLAEKAEWNADSSFWRIFDYKIRDFTARSLIEGKTMDTLLALRPGDFGQRLNIAATMSFNELNQKIQEEKEKGADNAVYYEIEKHQRTALPFATYVLTLIGVSIGSRKVRGGIGLHIAVGFFIALLYIFAMKITGVAATNAGLNSFVALWIPNVLFLLLGIGVYKLAQK